MVMRAIPAVAPELGAPSGWCPIKVAVIDVERCPDSIDAGSDYCALWALVRQGGRPRAIMQLPFDGAALSRAQLEGAIAELAIAPAAVDVARRDRESLPKISVVIPTMVEREELLRACVRSLAALDYPDYETIVVDNRPAGAPPIELAGVRVVREPRPGLSAARNRGLEAAQGEIIAFTDDDVEVDPGWLLAIALRMSDHPEEVCVTGQVIPRELETPAQAGLEEYYGGFGPRSFEPVSHRLRWPAGLRSLLRPATVDAIADDGRVIGGFSLYATGSFGIGANMSFRTQALRELGGFSLALGPGTPSRNGEELEVFARLAWQGHCLGFEPAAVVKHTHRREIEALRRQIHNYGMGYAALLTALVLRDPRHLGRILGTARLAVPIFAGYFGKKLNAEQPSQLIRELARLELTGMAAGPAAYLRGLLRAPR